MAAAFDLLIEALKHIGDRRHIRKVVLGGPASGGLLGSTSQMAWPQIFNPQRSDRPKGGRISIPLLDSFPSHSELQ